MAWEAALRLQEKREVIPEEVSEFNSTYLSKVLRSVLEFNRKPSNRFLYNGEEEFSKFHRVGTEDPRPRQPAYYCETFPPQPALRMAQLLRGTVTIAVGPKRTSFVMHRDLASRFSEYFRGARRGGFEESRKNEVLLEDEDPSTVAMMVEWLYSSSLGGPALKMQFDYDSDDDHDINMTRRDRLRKEQRELQKAHQEDLMRLYILADRRGIRELRNQIITACERQSESGWPLLSTSIERIKTAHDQLPGSSTMLRYLEHEAYNFWRGDIATAEGFTTLPPRFVGIALRGALLRLAAAGHESLSSITAWRSKICRFHEHDDDATRENCRLRKQYSSGRSSYGRNEAEAIRLAFA